MKFKSNRSQNKKLAQAVVLCFGLTVSTLALAGPIDALLAPFCNVQKFFSGQSPVVGFAVLLGLAGIAGALVMGEDKGLLGTVVKWAIGGALLVAGPAVITALFGISFGCS